MVILRMVNGSITGEGATLYEAVRGACESFGPYGEFMISNGDRIIDLSKNVQEPDPSTELQVMRLSSPSSYPEPGVVQYRREDDPNGEIVRGTYKRMRMYGKQKPVPPLPQWYLDICNQDTHAPVQWGLRMPMGLAEIITCPSCGAITTEMGTILNLWTLHGEPCRVSPADGIRSWSCTTGLSDYPKQCCRCTANSDMKFVCHCGRCQWPLHEDSFDDVNTRGQAEGIIWCAACSSGYSGNFTGA